MIRKQPPVNSRRKGTSGRDLTSGMLNDPQSWGALTPGLYGGRTGWLYGDMNLKCFVLGTGKPLNAAGKHRYEEVGLKDRGINYALN